jgi:hypothetical protein
MEISRMQGLFVVNSQHRTGGEAGTGVPSQEKSFLLRSEAFG